MLTKIKSVVFLVRYSQKKYNGDRHVKNFHTHENCDNGDESSENNLYVPTTAEILCTHYKIEVKRDSQNKSVAAMP